MVFQKPSEDWDFRNVFSKWDLFQASSSHELWLFIDVLFLGTILALSNKSSDECNKPLEHVALSPLFELSTSENVSPTTICLITKEMSHEHSKAKVKSHKSKEVNLTTMKHGKIALAK